MLILASSSTTRQRLLTEAGIPFRAIPASINERELDARLAEATPETTATHLAQAKALAVSQQHPNHYVLGADQLLSCQGMIYHKPHSRADARTQLLALRGRTHALHTAICFAHNGQVIETHCTTPLMRMREFSDTFLDNYLHTQSSDVLKSPGCYRYEETGIQLFDKIDGDMHSILGLPILPILQFLRNKDLLPT